MRSVRNEQSKPSERWAFLCAKQRPSSLIASTVSSSFSMPVWN